MFTTTRLLDQVKLKATLPIGRYEDQEILDVAYDVLLSHIVPMILGLKEEYYVTSESQSITSDQANYSMPYRAFGLSLREIKRVVQRVIHDLPRIDPTDIVSTATGTPTNFYLEGQDVILYPTPGSTTGSLKLSYYITPSKLVPETECAVITAIDRNTGIVTADCPASWSTGDPFDFVSSKNGHKSLATDLSASSVSTTSITFTAADIPSALTVNDHICLANEAPYMQAPDSIFPLLVQLTSNELLEDMGDQAMLQIGQSKAEQLKAMATSSLSNRVQGSPKRTIIRL